MVGERSKEEGERDKKERKIRFKGWCKVGLGKDGEKRKKKWGVLP
jgi:hypothetical protein